MLSSVLLSDVTSIKYPKNNVTNSLSKKDIILITRGPLGKTEFISAPSRKKVSTFKTIIRVESDEITPEYLLYVMNSQYFKMRLHKLKRGVTIPTVTIRDLGTIRIPIIPLAQQKKKGAAFMKLYNPYQKALKKYDSAGAELKKSQKALESFR